MDYLFIIQLIAVLVCMFCPVLWVRIVLYLINNVITIYKIKRYNIFGGIDFDNVKNAFKDKYYLVTYILLAIFEISIICIQISFVRIGLFVLKTICQVVFLYRLDKNF